jgi:CheY-like chemotaxis protein
MGLATMHGIVHEHHGHIVVEGRPGQGATFRVLLPPLDPAVNGSAPRSRAGATVREERPTLSGRVLLVDDETSVLGFMRELLENWGLEVTALTNPLDARRLVESDEVGFDLLLADQTMPRLTGTELARHLAPLRPEMPILLYTGYRDGVSPSDLNTSGVRAVLDKPVDPQALHAQLHRYLGGASPTTPEGIRPDAV